MKPIVLALIILCVLLVGCGLTKGLSVEEFYLQSLKLDRMPDDVSDLQGAGTDKFPVFLSEGYFKYKAKASYFEMLSKYDNFIEQSEMNKRVHTVQCDGPDMPGDYGYWTTDLIEVRNKSCFSGLFFPYLHYIIYDPATLEVRHFITGVRD